MFQRGHLGACAPHRAAVATGGHRRHHRSEWERTPERHTGGHREIRRAGGQNLEQLFELRDVRSFGPRQANDARTGPKKLVSVQRFRRDGILLCRGEPQRLDDHGGQLSMDDRRSCARLRVDGHVRRSFIMANGKGKPGALRRVRWEGVAGGVWECGSEGRGEGGGGGPARVERLRVNAGEKRCPRPPRRPREEDPPCPEARADLAAR